MKVKPTDTELSYLGTFIISVSETTKIQMVAKDYSSLTEQSSDVFCPNQWGAVNTGSMGQRILTPTDCAP